LENAVRSHAARGDMVLYHLVTEVGEIEFRLAFGERHGGNASQSGSDRIDRRQSGDAAIRLLHCAKMRETPLGGNFLRAGTPRTKLTAGPCNASISWAFAALRPVP
jgi:hypothetical protein